jgi:uncharacterized protein GlcG (DUF336 family)
LSNINLDTAQKIVSQIMAAAADRKLEPVAVALLDARGSLKAFAAQDDAAIARGDFAITKAVSVISMGMGSRSLEMREKAKPDFVRAASQVLGKAFMTMRGGVLFRNDRGDVIGAVGVSGDSSVNDELVAIEGITAAGFVADPGEN